MSKSSTTPLQSLSTSSSTSGVGPGARHTRSPPRQTANPLPQALSVGVHAFSGVCSSASTTPSQSLSSPSQSVSTSSASASGTQSSPESLPESSAASAPASDAP